MLSLTSGIPIAKITESKKFPEKGVKATYLGLVETEFLEEEGGVCISDTPPEIESFPVDGFGGSFPKISASKAVKALKKKKNVIKDYFRSICLKSDGKFECVPIVKPEYRDTIFVAGASGSGKSYWTCQYINNYLDLFPENQVFIFSLLSDDRTFSKMIKQPKKIVRFGLKDPEFIELIIAGEAPQAEDFESCLCVFDDCGACTNAPVKKYVNNLRDQILEIGRHNLIYTITTEHNPTKGNETKKLLTESGQIVIFPSKITYRMLEYLMSQYYNIDTVELKRIMGLRTKYWVLVNRVNERYVIWEKGAYMLD